MESIMAVHVEQLVLLHKAERPEVWDGVEFVRFVDDDDASEVYDACIRGYGVTTVTVGEGGSLSWMEPDDDNLTESAINACSAQYPYAIYREIIRTDDQLAYLYNYGTNFLVPCLQAAGYTPEESPSWDEYLSTAHTDLWAWSPYVGINFASDRRWSNYRYDSPELVAGEELLHQRCPPDPAGMEPEY
jgi:hypothetical protein